MSRWFKRNNDVAVANNNNDDDDEGGPSSSNGGVGGASAVASKATETVQRRCTPPKNPPWKVRTDKLTDHLGNKIGTYKVLVFKRKKAAQLCNILSSITRQPTFYSDNPEIRLHSLLYFLDTFKTSFDGTGSLQPLIDFLEFEYYDEIKEIEAMIANDEITFYALWYLFKKGSKYACYSGERLVGSTVKNTGYDTSLFGGHFFVDGDFVATNGRTFVIEQRQHTVSMFDGLRKISELKLRPMTDAELQQLSARGAVFKEIAIGSHYRYYTGSMTFNTGYNLEKFRANGRIMIDAFNFARFNPSNVAPNLQASRNTYLTEEEDNDKTHALEIPEDKIFCTLPTVSAFSFAVKRWGEVHVSGVSHIQFDSKAFSQLVLDPQRKAVVKSLVENGSRSFTDIISGKGGGCIFLLHGPPGTGKTLTAEAIADLLQKPLYSVTVGELGTTPEGLESKLRQILELTSMWSALLLLDEADIFLERRSNSELQRNALVGIFLRLMEYHQGVLFLTSNRVKCFDEAFHSRVSIALHYEALNRKARRQVFDNLLQAAGIPSGTIDTKKMSKHELNGRQIKSTIRLGQTLAYSEGVPLALQHLERTVALAAQFNDDLASSTSIAVPVTIGSPADDEY